MLLHANGLALCYLMIKDVYTTCKTEQIIQQTVNLCPSLYIILHIFFCIMYWFNVYASSHKPLHF